MIDGLYRDLMRSMQETALVMKLINRQLLLSGAGVEFGPEEIQWADSIIDFCLRELEGVFT